VDSYGRELAEVSAKLQRGDLSTSVRGEGAAGFVFAERGSRSVELSRNGTVWWIEFWEGEAPAEERTFASCDETVLAACVWLGVSTSE